MFIRLALLGLAAASLLSFAPASPKATLAGEHIDSVATYRVDPVHSSTIFRIKHNRVAYFYGRFNEISGTIEWDESDPSASSIDIIINAASVDTANEQRDDHLRSSDFFTVEEYPTIHFRTTKIEKRDDKYRAAGELTLLGVTKPITVDLEHTGTTTHRGATLIGLHSTFTIKRTDFNMPFGVEAGTLGDEVLMLIGIEGIKQ